MKLNVALALVALFAAQALCFESRTLLKSAEAGTDSYLKAEDGTVGTKLGAFSKGGKSYASAKGFAKAEEKVASDFIYFFKVVLDKYYLKKVCKENPYLKKCCPKAYEYIDEELKLKAYAIAKAYAEVTVNVYVEGKGKSCGAGDAYAYEKAEAFLKACVKAIVAAKVGYSYSKAVTFVKGYKTLVAEAFAKAWAAACVTDGFAVSYQKAFAVAISKVCVKLVLDMVAYEGCTLEKTKNDSYLKEKEDEEVYAGAVSKDYIDGEGFVKGGAKSGADTEIEGEFKKYFYP